MQCNKVFAKKIIAATDNTQIKKVCDKNNINVMMTSKKCLTGTDRVAEVALKIKANNYINVQGDEPFFNPNDLKKLIKIVKQIQKNLQWIHKIKNEKIFESPSIPKLYSIKKKS